MSENLCLHCATVNEQKKERGVLLFTKLNVWKGTPTGGQYCTCIFTKHEAVQKADFQSSQDGGFHEYSGVCCELVKDVHVFFDISKEQALQNTAVILYSTCAVQ